MRNDYTNSLALKKLPIYKIRCIEHKEKGRNYHLKTQSHIDHELIYVDYGRIRLQVHGETNILNTGDCFLIPGKVTHVFSGVSGKPFDFLNIVFSGKLPENISCQKIHLTLEERNILLRMKHESLEMSSFYREISIIKFNEFIYSLQRRKDFFYIEKKVVGGNINNYRSQIAKQAVSFLRQNFSSPLDSKRISRHVGISPSYLRVLMLNGTGKSLRRHLREIRIEISKRLLRDSPDNINTIAYKVGYQSPPHFCTIFKKEVGKTPSEYARSFGDTPPLKTV